MASPSPPPQPQPPSALPLRLTRLALSIANGQHALSALIPPLLFLFDAVLCALIIWKVPCELPPPKLKQTTAQLADTPTPKKTPRSTGKPT